MTTLLESIQRQIDELQCFCTALSSSTQILELEATLRGQFGMISFGYNRDFLEKEGWCFDITLAGDRQALAHLWGELRRRGWELAAGCARPEEGSPSWYGHFTRTGEDRIWVNFSSTVCRRVQTGTRTVEEPIYETVCDDGAPPLETGCIVTGVPPT